MSNKIIYTCDICGREDTSDKFLVDFQCPPHKRSTESSKNIRFKEELYEACGGCRDDIGALVETLKLRKKQVAGEA